MQERNFWRLTGTKSTTYSTARLAEWVHGQVKLDSVRCPMKEGHRRGGKRLTDLTVALRGRGVEDFVWTWHSECLIQDHVLDFFHTSGFSGFDVKPVKAKFKRAANDDPPRLWELIVTGWAGMASAESGIKLTEECRGCGLLVYSGWTDSSKLIDVSQWDGSDFFIVWPMPKFIFVTDRVARATIRDLRFSKRGLFAAPADLRLGMVPFIGPGRLSYRMPEDRARQLGGPLGIA